MKWSALRINTLTLNNFRIRKIHHRLHKILPTLLWINNPLNHFLFLKQKLIRILIRKFVFFLQIFQKPFKINKIPNKQINLQPIKINRLHSHSLLNLQQSSIIIPIYNSKVQRSESFTIDNKKVFIAHSQYCSYDIAVSLFTSIENSRKPVFDLFVNIRSKKHQKVKNVRIPQPSSFSNRKSTFLLIEVLIDHFRKLQQNFLNALQIPTINRVKQLFPSKLNSH